MSAPENGSIAEEIDDEEIDEDISIEADDLLHSEKSGVSNYNPNHSTLSILLANHNFFQTLTYHKLFFAFILIHNFLKLYKKSEK